MFTLSHSDTDWAVTEVSPTARDHGGVTGDDTVTGAGDDGLTELSTHVTSTTPAQVTMGARQTQGYL